MRPSRRISCRQHLKSQDALGDFVVGIFNLCEVLESTVYSSLGKAEGDCLNGTAIDPCAWWKQPRDWFHSPRSVKRGPDCCTLAGALQVRVRDLPCAVTKKKNADTPTICLPDGLHNRNNQTFHWSANSVHGNGTRPVVSLTQSKLETETGMSSPPPIVLSVDNCL